MKRAAFWGVLIWVAATIFLRLAGQHILALHPLVLLGASAPAMALLARAVVRRPVEGMALVAPGMLLDTFTTIRFAEVFPNVQPDAAGLFGGWLLFCNAVALVAAATRRLDGPKADAYTPPRLSREP